MPVKSQPLIIKSLVVGPFSVNCYLIAAADQSSCVIVDPGGDFERILTAIDTMDCLPEAILLTHGHLDHVLALPELAKRLGIPVFAHRAEKQLLQNMHSQAMLLGLANVPEVWVDRWLEEKDTIHFGSGQLSVLWTPGHSPGSCAYLGPEEVFVGDTLFSGSVGRTDLPGGDAAKLLQSIREKLFALPDFFVVYPGHGPATTIGQEKKNNPFVGINA